MIGGFRDFQIAKPKQKYSFDYFNTPRKTLKKQNLPGSAFSIVSRTHAPTKVTRLHYACFLAARAVGWGS
jgi:hypothetical protein